MKLKFADAYTGSKAIPFPSEDIPQSMKQNKDYFLFCAKAILSKYVNNRCAVPYDKFGSKRTFGELRLYADGQNSPAKYKDMLVGRPDKEGERRKTTMNISWDTLQILPEKLDVVMGFFMKMFYEVTTSATDYQSIVDKQMQIAMAKLMAHDKMRLMRKNVNAAVGGPVLIGPDQADNPSGVEFQNPRQVDLFASVGGFALAQEAAIKTLLDKTLYESTWDVIKDQLIKDFLVLGIAGTCGYTEKATGISKRRYVDPDMAIIPGSKYNDFRDATWGGEIEKMTIARLRRESDLSDAELIEIARKYTDGINGGPGFYDQAHKQLSYWHGDGGFDMNMIDQIEVDVADVRWIGTKGSQFTFVQREREKNMAVSRVAEDYKLSRRDERKGKKFRKFSTQTVYKAKLVVGCDHVFDIGEESDIGYKKDAAGNMNVVFPYRFYRTGTSSIVERCIGFIDDANLSNLKLRNAKAKMPAPPNLVVKKSALENIQIDGVTQSPFKLIKLLQDEGFLIADDQNAWGNNMSAGRPIDTIPTDIIKQLIEWRLDIEWNIQMIERVTGVNDIFSAQTPTAETGLGVSKLAIAATSNALFPITKAYEYIFEQSMRSDVARWQVIARYMPKEKRKRLSINRALKYIEISSDLDKYDFDIMIEAAPTEDEKLQLMQDVTRLRDFRRQAGSGGITSSDWLLVWNMIKSGKIKQAQLVLSQLEEARIAEDREREQQLVEQNMQSQMASNQQTAENQAALAQRESDLDLRNNLEVERAKAMFQAELQRQKSKQDRGVAAVQNVYGWSHGSYTRPNK